MNVRHWILIVPVCLACAACGGKTDTSSEVTGADVRQTSQQGISNATTAPGEALNAADLLLAQGGLHEEFDG